MTATVDEVHLMMARERSTRAPSTSGTSGLAQHHDRSAIVHGSSITPRGIPENAHRCRLVSRATIGADQPASRR